MNDKDRIEFDDLRDRVGSLERQVRTLREVNDNIVSCFNCVLQDMPQAERNERLAMLARIFNTLDEATKGRK
jgi:hypothetical protein